MSQLISKANVETEDQRHFITFMAKNGQLNIYECL